MIVLKKDPMLRDALAAELTTIAARTVHLPEQFDFETVNAATVVTEEETPPELAVGSPEAEAYLHV